MRNEVRGLALGMVLLASPALAQDALTGDPAAGEKVFRQCMACHAVGEGAANKVGPELNGIIGRTPGTLEGYTFSPAMIAFGDGHVWDAATLDEYLAAPRNVVKGTKMAYPGLRKDDMRADVIAYLAQFDDNGMAKGN